MGNNRFEQIVARFERLLEAPTKWDSGIEFERAWNYAEAAQVFLDEKWKEIIASYNVGEYNDNK